MNKEYGFIIEDVQTLRIFKFKFHKYECKWFSKTC